MQQLYNPRILATVAANNQLPEVIPSPGPSGPPASEAYQNVQVLKTLSVGEFTRFMVSITNWVAPEQGCAYCHNTDNMAADTVYTKVVARRMIQMVRHINADWTTHVAATGVTCFTCHRGQPVPANYFVNDPGPAHADAIPQTGKNYPAASAGLTSLPYDPFTAFLEQTNNIRVESETALPTTDRQSIKQTDWTYALMMNISQALGVNCTYCHNTRQFSDWSQGSPQRVTAWYGIRMARDINNNYLNPLKAVLPVNRLGPLGDAAKANCATCHNGVYKPFFGASMLKDFPELAK
jgi:photosynthetic reaction center cytochrome c subunit